MTAPVPVQPYPVAYSFDPPERIARWRPLVHWILAIPQFFVLYALGILAEILALVAWILGIFTGRVPDGILGALTMYTRYNLRVTMYVLFLQEEYPPFEFSTAAADPGTYPHTRLDIAREVEGRNRLTIFFRIFMVIPHFIVLAFIGIAMAIVLLVGFIAVLILGRWPVGMRSFVIGAIRWSTRVNAYFYLLTDRYPPFSFE